MSLMADLIIENAGQLVTLAGLKELPVLKPDISHLAIIEDGAVACENGKIVDIGRTFEINSRVSLKEKGKRISASGKLVCPGFIDPHSHVIYGGSRVKELQMRLQGKTYVEIQEAGGGIHFTVNATRNTSKEELKARGREIFLAMLRHGTTTLETKSGYGLNLEKELETLEIIKELDEELEMDLVPTFLGAHLVPEEYLDKREDFVELLIKEMIPEVARNNLAEFCDVFCENKAFNVKESREILLAAKEKGMIPRIHADELFSSGGSELAGEIGAISADHLNFISEEGIKSLAENRVIATLLPGTSFFLNLDRYPPARKMIDQGVAVALATDFNAGSCWTYSMQMIITLACLKMRMTPEEALIAATINPACAINRENIAGSVEPGKKADMIICQVPDYSHLPFYFGTNLINTVIKNGKIVFST